VPGKDGGTVTAAPESGEARDEVAAQGGAG
jgi:hypothetical protein